MIDNEMLERFWKKVDKTSTGCWEWKGWRNSDGYGFFRYFNKKEIQAHRFSAKHIGGMNIDGMVVCHSCDNPGCVNPNHLFPGTQQDNIKDMHKKGRNYSHAIQTPIGIFSSQAAAARAYKVDPTTIKNWLRLQPNDFKRI